MITFEVFLIGLLIVSAFTSLVTEAVKTLLHENKIACGTNTLVAIVSAVLSTAVGVGYVIISGIAFTAQIIACIIALIFLSWLCAMVGYDKVIQVITQFTKPGKE
jgi:ABC-type nitrate/sulfonate/bicarbonate transport system permease component